MPEWIGVDLDGTLAMYTRWKGVAHIGKPVPAMVSRVRRWIRDGRTVKIMTARVSEKGAESFIRAWLIQAGLPEDLEITDRKDMDMVELWDDRCVRVQTNTGKVLSR
jgi:hypothetical protein